MARLPRPIRHFFRRFKPKAPDNPNAVNPQAVGTFSRGTRLYLPTPMMIALIGFAAAIAVAQIMQALRAGDARTQIAVPGAIGTLHSVFMPGNQVFIGTLESVDRGSVVLSDVFYLQSQSAQAGTPATNAQGGVASSRGAQLVRRVDNDWHQPTHMAIPIDKIIMMENVGRESIVYRLVTEGRARQMGAQPPR